MGNSSNSKFSSHSHLLNLARNHYEFLDITRARPHYYLPKVLKGSLYRYEKYWLPFAASHTKKTVIAPLDIELIWHMHMMHPKYYEQDCIRLFGKIFLFRALLYFGYYESRSSFPRLRNAISLRRGKILRKNY